MAIPIFRPSIKRRDMDRVLTCMVSDRLGPGPLAKEFTHFFSDYLGAAGGVSTVNYHMAIFAALDTFGVERGDRVIISSLAPQAYLEVFRQRGIQPLTADVDPDTCMMLQDAVKAFLDKNPRAIIINNTLGCYPDTEVIDGYSLPVITDFSQGFNNANTPGKAMQGDIMLLSLAVDNIITAAGGGLVLARGKKDYKNLSSIFEEQSEDLLLCDMNAALGLAQLKSIEKFISTRKEIGEIFRRSLKKSRHRTIASGQDSEVSFYSFPVLLEYGIKEVRQYALKQGIETRHAFLNSLVAAEEHLKRSCPNSMSLLSRCILFPLYPSLGKRNVELISRVLSTLP